MDAEIIDREELIVVGVRSVLSRQDQDATRLWRDGFLPRKAELKSAGGLVYGVLGAIPDGNAGACEYVAGVAANSLEGIPEGMVGWPVPAGRYARIAVAGLAGIVPACRKFVAEWLPKSGYRLSESPIFFYGASEQSVAPDTVWKANLPVEKPEELEAFKKWIS